MLWHLENLTADLFSSFHLLIVYDIHHSCMSYEKFEELTTRIAWHLLGILLSFVPNYSTAFAVAVGFVLHRPCPTISTSE